MPSSARLTRSGTGCGWMPCSTSRCPTRSSAAAASHADGTAARWVISRASASPYTSVSALAASSPVVAVAPGICSSRPSRSSSAASLRSTSWSVSRSAMSGAEHRGMHLGDRLPAADVHVHPARQAGVEAADGAHDVHALEVVRAVLLEDRHVLHRVLVRAGGAEGVAGAAVPRRRRVGVVVRDLLVLDDQVVR